MKSANDRIYKLNPAQFTCFTQCFPLNVNLFLLIHLSDFKHQMTWARPEIQTWAPSHHPLMNSPSSSLPCSSADPTLEVSTGSFHPCLWRPASSCLKMLSGPRWVCDSYMGRQETLWINLCG